jgi:hypothetical protein
VLREKLLEMIGAYAGAEGQTGKQTGLNQYQKRSVEVVLRNLEKAVDTLEEIVISDKKGLLYSRTISLSAEQRSRVAELAGEIKAEIAELAATFDLGKYEMDSRQAIASMLAIAFEGLEDTHSEKLDRYGDIDPSLPVTLDPHIDRLIDTVLALSRVVTSNESQTPSGVSCNSGN